MASIAFTLPILPGKTEDFRRFVGEALGPRRNERIAARRRVGITKERIWIQHTPRGDMLLLYLEMDDKTRDDRAFFTSQDPYDLWFKPQIQSITGIDLNQPPPGPPPELVFEWEE